MSTSLPGFQGPSASTEAPLEMLAACHYRIQRQCATLRRLREHLPQHGSDQQARQAARNVMRYFDTAAVHHHEDEEKDLFPALLEAMAGSDAVCIRQLTQGLQDDHRQLEAAWRRIRQQLLQIEAGVQVPLSESDIDAFIEAYARHMRIEEDEVFPMAERLLDDTALQAMGRSMRLRRGITDDQI
ncbi:hemerythrin domain-containing protein [Allopusillimonas soli]|uniref:Hemerythrin domain-containing protein n=1 Tax=Allopusillimonas soli TaxID=659016 RepID=A0A853FEQ0_9BURK|nr:hemerythrin domain-containing protein [Allopusillimonas soli]NYT36516.1 hemerythrin domain-containing protein [Allopusillimonas soli]TEA75018.1 hemerythrin domain-containing protein [Allopusillimonas soli]